MNSPVVLITGALTGIGRATAFAYAKEGARIVVSGRRESVGHALAAELQALGVEAEFVMADVRHEADVRNLVDKTVERFGRLDIAVNNAGTEGQPGPLMEQSVESYTKMFDTNVLGTFLSMKHELRVMTVQGHGSIVNLSSTMGSRGAAGMSMYVASKHAVEGMTAAALDSAAEVCVSTQSLPAPSKRKCWTALRAMPTKRLRWPPACPSNASENPKKSHKPSCLWRRTRLSSSQAKSSPSMAVKQRHKRLHEPLRNSARQMVKHYSAADHLF